MSACARGLAAVMLAWGALSLAAPAGAGAQPALQFGPCRSEQVVTPAAGLQCATLDVPFDRANAAAGTIALAVQRIPARTARAGVIVLLAGGPGQPAIPAFEDLLAPLAREAALAGFELVAFDQRGTGQSEGLVCPLGAGGILKVLKSLFKGPGGFLGECGASLGATRAFYSSQESVDDLEVLREALGGVPLSLLAVSYGGRIAGMYAREFPSGVARMVLDSPTPVAGSDPLGSERLRALHRVFDEGVCGAGDCRSFSADVYADLANVVARLHRRPVRTSIYDARGRLRRVRLTDRAVLRLVTRIDLSQGARALAPAAIAAAARGDDRPLARLAVGVVIEPIGGRLSFPQVEIPPPAPGVDPFARGEQSATAAAPESASAISFALFAATYCIENRLPWSPDSPTSGRPATLRGWLASLPAGTTAPFAPSTVVGSSAISLCLDWPETPPAPPPPTGVSAAPTLILSGDDDVRTPYEQDLAISAGYSNARLLRIPDVGHSTVSQDASGCARRAMIEFLATGLAPASCPSASEPQALPLPPTSLSDVRSVASRSHLAGRVAAAVAITLEDVLGEEALAGGGLRGGYWTPAPPRLVLHRVTDVPGVAVSGTIRLEEDPSSAPGFFGRLTVRGRLGGRLTLRGRTLSGRVGGARVQAHLEAV